MLVKGVVSQKHRNKRSGSLSHNKLIIDDDTLYISKTIRKKFKCHNNMIHIF